MDSRTLQGAQETAESENGSCWEDPVTNGVTSARKGWEYQIREESVMPEEFGGCAQIKAEGRLLWFGFIQFVLSQILRRSVVTRFLNASS